LAWVEEDLPPLQPGEILVQTAAGAVSVGTELPLYRGIHRGSRPVDYPRMTGYESLGRVIACGAGVETPQVGERVVAFYGHRTLAIVPAIKAIPVPAQIPDPLALLCILSCDVTKGIDKLRPQPGERVLVTGAGTIGVLTVFNLAARGVKDVDVLEPLSNRRALAIRLGARTAFPPGDRPPESGGYSLGFECSSRNVAFERLQEYLAHGGRICVLSDGNLEPLLLSPHFHEKELSVVSSSDGVDYPAHARWFFAHALSRQAPLEDLYEEETPAGKLPAVFEEMAEGKKRPVKVLVRYT
jgi:alcohol dehydrogenase